MPFESFSPEYHDIVEGEVLKAYLISKKRKTPPRTPVGERRKQLEKLRDGCREVYKLIDEMPAELRILFDYDSVSIEDDKLTAIEHLKHFADGVAQRAEEEIPLLPHHNKKLKNPKTRDFILRLSIIFGRYAGHRPSLTMEDGELIGPFADFLIEVADLVKEKPQVILRRARMLSKSLAKVHDRLDSRS
jgi:hypothetical protein